jgi:hypothetical protein
VLIPASFSGNFWPNVIANVVGGLAVVGLAYLVIERRLHLREQRQAEQRDRVRRWELVQDVLLAVDVELTHNALQAELIVDHVQQEELPYPAFETNGWLLISQSPVFSAINPGTLRRLLRVYNRLRSANDFHAKTYDFLFGSTAVLAVVGIESLDDPGSREAHQRAFTEHRGRMRDDLTNRVRELQPHLVEALQRVQQELAGRPPGTDTADLEGDTDGT